MLKKMFRKHKKPSLHHSNQKKWPYCEVKTVFLLIYKVHFHFFYVSLQQKSKTTIQL